MTAQLKPRWLGLTCAGLARATHPEVLGKAGDLLGPLVISWSDGTSITFDVRSDWHLQIAEGPWQDPFAQVSPQERAQLRDEVGLWELAQVGGEDALSSLVGQVAVNFEEKRNSFGHVEGLNIAFSSGLLLELSVWEGELSATLRRGAVS